MKTKYLFPHAYKTIGWLLFVPGLVLGVLYLFGALDSFQWEVPVFSIAQDSVLGNMSYFAFTTNDVKDELIGLLLIIGSLLLAFSKEKSEDEFIASIRLESLVWATYVNYIILIFTMLFIYDMTFFWVLVFNMFTILIFFIIRFNWALYASKKQLSDEE